ncbi:zinc ribbon domain-containing protein [Trichormus sp. NMC-1]|uniref:zinc ribbon domain-containing protein n=1 Tax=Trichormus sp. NMC-1 TaxID=1853259 RepID=UPI0008DBF6A5|nr:zinc ribbon domain-containing protein [Trichormus sp. NMC-1]
MFTRIRLFLSRFFHNSQTINNEPLNKVSLIVIILVDIFILINVFTGLDNISRWHLSPAQAYPCYSEWNSYNKQTTKDKDFEILRNSLPYNTNTQSNFRQIYQQQEIGHLGKVSEICLNYGEAKDKLNNSENRQTLTAINQTKDNINKLSQANLNIRNQYDSTLLEKIAGQSPGNSINQVGAEKAKQELDNNNRKISTFKQKIASLQSQLLTKPETIDFLSFLKDETKFTEVDKGYQNASFWYPSLQLIFQSVFLLPLIIIALLAHQFSVKRGYGLIALISWHLLVIFLIPLILKIFQFLQIGAIAEFIFNIISQIFGSLLFLISYVYIFLIPLVGFGLIKFFQTVVFNTKFQAAKRVQKSQCINCAKTIKSHDAHCPHCGYYQYVECHNCHNLTYKKLPYCYHCGADQNPNHS